MRVTLASCQALLQRVEGNTMGSVITIGVLLVAIGGGLVYNTCIRNNCSAELCYTLLASYCTK